MILFKCPACGCLSAIEEKESSLVAIVECPNNKCRKKSVLYDNKQCEEGDSSMQALFNEIKTKHIGKIGRAEFDDNQLNVLIKDLSDRYQVGNVLICELFNAMLNEPTKDAVGERKKLYFAQIKEREISIQELIGKIDNLIKSKSCIITEDDIALRIAMQKVETIKQEKHKLEKQLEKMNEDIRQLKTKLERYR